MRVTPTREQMAYLASVGVSSETIAQPGPRSAPPLEDRSSPGSGSAGRVLQWWAMLLVIIAFLISLAGLARAQEPSPARQEAATSGDPADRRVVRTPVERLDAIEAEIDGIKEAVGRAATGEQMVVNQQEIVEIDRRLASLRKTLLEDTSEHRDRVNREIQLIQADIGDIRANLAAMTKNQGHRTDEIAALVTSTAQQTDVRLNQARYISEKLVETRMDALRGRLDEQRKDFNQAVVWIVVIGAMGVGIIIVGRIFMENRMRQVEQAAISALSETAAAPNGCPTAPESAKPTRPVLKSETEKKTAVEPTRPQPQLPPEPAKQMQSIIASAGKFRHIRVKPTLPSKIWELGLATHKGNVRSENQDYGVCFQIDGHDVLVVADGCGGVPHGQRAAYLAVVSAAVSVVRTYGMAPRWNTPHVKDAAAKAIMDAAHRLAVEGDKLNVTDVRGGLRTTLIVVIGNKRELGYAYIGDGGGCVVKPCGEVHRFLDPHKANDFAMNVLSASLGPLMEGEPATGVLKRQPGDILIVGTDGVFDRVDKTFPKDVLRGCIQYAGDFQKTAEHILGELAFFQDGAGYICDDNLTLGLMGDGTAPKLSPAFWSPVHEDTAAGADAEATCPAAPAREGIS